MPMILRVAKEHDVMPKTRADQLDKAVAELIEHGHDDLPEGPTSPLGGEARPNPLVVRSEAEIHRLADRGKLIVDRRIAARQNEQAS